MKGIARIEEIKNYEKRTTDSVHPNIISALSYTTYSENGKNIPGENINCYPQTPVQTFYPNKKQKT